MAIIYLAGVPGGGWKKGEYRLRKLWKHRMWSYFSLITEAGMKPNKKLAVDLFLDSGAFSAWAQKTEIDISDYIAFVKKYQRYITVYANLDVIGDPEATWKNQEIMEKAGLNPLPVYHLEDDVSYLERCIKEYEYFCIGGMARGFNFSTRLSFLDKCFELVCDQPSRLPKAKVHGFGMTSLKLLLRYPWYSVDSTSWLVTGRNGSVFVPFYSYKEKRYIYNENSMKVTVSNRSPKMKTNNHIETLTENKRKVILKYFESKGFKLGKSEFFKKPKKYKLRKGERWFGKADENGERMVERVIERGLSNSYKIRDRLNIIYFMDLEKNMTPWPWPFELKIKRFF